MARRLLRGRHGGPRRQTTWIGPADQAYLAVAADVNFIHSSFDPAANGIVKPTVVRTRGAFSFKINTNLTADAEIVGAYGCCVVSDQAFAAGAASIPSPFDDASWDGWFVWRAFAFSFRFDDSTGFLIDSLQQEIDSKAMRKVTENETIVTMIHSLGAGEVAMPIRTLLKLS